MAILALGKGLFTRIAQHLGDGLGSSNASANHRDDGHPGSQQGLLALSNEIFECIVQYLDIDTIRSLRLASRESAHKATQSTFRSFFRRKRLLLTRENLEIFVSVTAGDGLGCLVEDLTLVGIEYESDIFANRIKYGKKVEEHFDVQTGSLATTVYTKSELAEMKQRFKLLWKQQQDWAVLRQNGSDVAYLRSAFSHIAAHAPAVLRSITLDVGIADDFAKPLLPPSVTGWRVQIYARHIDIASQTFTLAMTSLRESGLTVPSLNIFHSTIHCGVPNDRLDGLRQYSRVATSSLSSLRALSITLAEPQVCNTSSLAAAQSAEAHDQDHSELSKMLLCCPQLETLRMSRYGYPGRVSTSDQALTDSRVARGFHRIAYDVKLPRLRALYLGGWKAASADLVQFLQNHHLTLREIELVSCQLVSGTVYPLLGCLANKLTLDDLRLEHILESMDLVLFTQDVEQTYLELSGWCEGRFENRRIGEKLHCWGKGTKHLIMSCRGRAVYDVNPAMRAEARTERHRMFGGDPRF